MFINLLKILFFNSPTLSLIHTFLLNTLENSPLACSVDIWSAGCTLCELFTGEVTFPGNSNNDMLKYIQSMKGHIPHKLIKNHIKSYIEMGREPYFTDDYKFKYPTLVIHTAFHYIIYRIRSRTQPSLNMKNSPNQQFALKMYCWRQRELLKIDNVVYFFISVIFLVIRSFADFLEKCFMINPAKRITPQDALRHPFLAMTNWCVCFTK